MFAMDDKEVSLFVTAFASHSTPKKVSSSNSLEFDLTDSNLILFQGLYPQIRMPSAIYVVYH